MFIALVAPCYAGRMFSSVEEFFEEAAESARTFDAFAARYFTETEAAADHICYKCGTTETFEAIRTLFEHQSEFIYQSIISGRRIGYIKFQKPLTTALGPVWFLELSDQKPDGSQTDGFDHVEVFPVSLSYETMVERLAAKEKVIHVERPHHTTDDVHLPDGFIFRCSHGPLVEKITATEMH